MKYYEHRQTTPIYLNGIKLLNGDVYIRDDNGIRVIRNGKVIFLKNDVNETKEKVEEVNEEILMKMTKKELEEYASKAFGVDIDRRKSKKKLVKVILEMEG